MQHQGDYTDPKYREQIEREELMFSLGLTKFKEKLQKQKVKNDYSRSAAGKYVEKTQLDVLAMAIEAAASSKQAGVNSREIQKLYVSLNNVTEYDLSTGLPTGETFSVWSSEVLALISLRLILDACQMPIYGINGDKTLRPNRRVLAANIGTHIESELMARQLRHYFPDTERRLGYISRIAKEAHTRNAGRDRARNAHQKRIQGAKNYWESQKSPIAVAFQWEPWSKNFKEMVARKCMGIVTAYLETQEGIKLFQDTENVGKQFFIGFTEAGEKWAESIDEAVGKITFVPLPMVIEPRDHTAEERGGYLDVDNTIRQKHLSRSFKGYLKPSDVLIDFANRSQQVAYRINPLIAGLLNTVYRESGAQWHIGGFGPIPNIEDYPIQMSDEIKALPSDHPDKIQARKDIEAAYDKHKEDEKCWKAVVPRFMDVVTISQKDDQFFIPTYLDFRGRVYFTSVGMSPQGSDYQKAILEWAEPVAVDDETEFWLMQQITSCMGYDKVSPAERVAKVLEVKQHLIDSVDDPLGTSWWKLQDKPWSLLAAAAEWVRLFVHKVGPRETRARVNFDASSSGQQHISGMTQDLETAIAVNITPSDDPNDLYGNVVEAVQARLEELDYIVPLKDGYVSQAKLRAIKRVHGKKVCLVAQYGAGTEARIDALYDYTNSKEGVQKLGVEGLTRSEASAVYRQLFADAIKQEMPSLDNYIKWCRGVVQAVFKDDLGRTLLLPSADESVVIQTYIKMDDSGRLKTDHIGSANFRTAKTPHQQLVTVEPTDVTVLEDQVKSAPPNLIHAQDRSALALALHDFEHPFATVHDSVYGRPSEEMSAIKQRLLSAYYIIFTSGVLEEFVTINGLSLEDHPVPMIGTYDPTLVLGANNAFS